MYAKRTYECRGQFTAHRVRGARGGSSSSGDATFAQEGDWVVEREGQHFAVSDAAFRAMFEPAAGEHPEGWEN